MLTMEEMMLEKVMLNNSLVVVVVVECLLETRAAHSFVASDRTLVSTRANRSIEYFNVF